MPSIRLDLEVNDKGTVKIKQFGQTADFEFKRVQKSAESTGSAMDHIAEMTKKAGMAIVAAFGAREIYEFTKSAIQVSIQMENLAKTMKLATGSSENAAEATAFLRSESEKLGLVFMDQIKGYNMIAAAGKSWNLTSKQTQEIYSGVANVAAAMNMTIDDTNGVFLAMSQIMSKGKLSAEEIRGQIGERLPGAFDLAAKSVGVTTSQLSKMLEEGKILSQDFIPKFAKVLTDTFGKAAVESADSTSKALARLSTAWTDLKIAMVSGGIMETFTSIVKFLTVIIKQYDQLNLLNIGLMDGIIMTWLRGKQYLVDYFASMDDFLSRAIIGWGKFVSMLPGSRGAGIIQYGEGLQASSISKSNAVQAEIDQHRASINAMVDAINQKKQIQVTYHKEIENSSNKMNNTITEVESDHLKKRLKEVEKDANERLKQIKRVSDAEDQEYEDLIDHVRKAEKEQFKIWEEEEKVKEEFRKYNIQRDKEVSKAKIDMLLREKEQMKSSIIDGWKYAAEAQTNFYEKGKQQSLAFRADVTKNFAGFINPLKDSFLDMKSLWENVLDSMVEKFTDAIAEMAVQAALDMGGQNIFGGILGAIGGFGNAVVDIVGEVGGGIISGISQLFLHKGTMEIKDDEVVATLQKGEMVLDKGTADMIRSLLNNGDPNMGGMSGLGFGGVAGATTENRNEIVALTQASIATLKSAGLGGLSGNTPSPVGLMGTFMSNLAGQLTGFTDTWSDVGATLSGIVGTALGGPALGAAASTAGRFLSGLVGDMLDMRDMEGMRDQLEDKYGRLEASRQVDYYNAMDISSSYSGRAGGIGESSSAAIGTMNADTAAGGVYAREGGVFSGPMSGYPATLHGTEAVVPTPSGNIPVEMKFSGQLPVINVYIGNEQLDTRIIRVADKLRVETARRNIGDRPII